jgi:serine/threonine protein kinase
MSELSAERFAQRLLDTRVLSESELQQVWAEFGSRNVSLDQFKNFLVGRELLTNFQIDKIERGQRIGFFYGDYKVLYRVGSGTYARVYRAAHRRTGEVVAVKVLRRRHSEDAEMTEQFCREGEVGCSLRHPNIVPIYDVVSDGGFHFLVMEFVEGRNLREFMKVRPTFDPLQATHLIIDTASGLSYAFERGVCHRDIKMSNVLISSHGRAKLVDFGLAAIDKGEGEPDESLSNPRTIDYAGLERASGVRKDDPRSDIYFLGCIYYQMLTGKPPLFETRDRMQRLSKTRFLEIPPIAEVDSTIPVIVATIVNRAMEFEPKLRYQSPGEMLAELENVGARLKDQADQQEGGEPIDAAAAIPQARQHTIMIIESDVTLQDILRDRLKRRGYRVLVTSDPGRAKDRFLDDLKAADCVVFNTERIGEPALGQEHLEWRERADEAGHRVVVPMPVRFSHFQALLDKLVHADRTK